MKKLKYWRNTRENKGFKININRRQNLAPLITKANEMKRDCGAQIQII